RRPDERGDDADEDRPQNPDALPSRDHESAQDADDNADDDGTDDAVDLHVPVLPKSSGAVLLPPPRTNSPGRTREGRSAVAADRRRALLPPRVYCLGALLAAVTAQIAPSTTARARMTTLFQITPASGLLPTIHGEMII